MSRTAIVAFVVLLVQPALGADGAGVSGTACRVVGLDTGDLCSVWKSDLLPAPVGRAAVVLASPDGARVFAAGTGLAPDGVTAGVIAAYRAADGLLLWNRSHLSPAGEAAEERALVLSPDGGTLYGLGAESGPGDRATLAALEAATGDEKWTLRLPFGGFFSTLGVAPDGSRVYVPTAAGGPAVAAVAEDGSLAWTRTLPGPGGANVVQLLPTPDGASVVVTSYGAGGTRFTSLAAADGAVRWSEARPVWLFSPGLDESALSPDGSRLFLAGFQRGLEEEDQWDYRILAFRTGDGSLEWETRYDDSLIPGSLEAAWALAVAPDGSAVHVTGLGTAASLDDDYLTVSLDAATGALRWVARFNAGPSTFDDVNAGIVASPDGARVYIGGTSSFHIGQMTMASYDARTGAEAWRMAYIAERDPIFGYSANGLSVAPDSGTLYVAGDANRAFFVAAYDRDLGSEL